MVNESVLKIDASDARWRETFKRRAVAGLLSAFAIICQSAGLLYSPTRSDAAQTSAKSADAFVDTIGVGLHLSYTRSPYWGRWEETKAALLALGVRHFRDGVTDCAAAASKAFCRHFEELGQAGLSGDFVTGLKVPMNIVSAFPAGIPHAFYTFEGPNEVDINGDLNWISDVAAYQQQLYTTVKSNPALAKYAVIGPAIGHIQNYAKVSDLSAYFDYGNLHNYLGPINPGTRGDGRITRWVASARSFNGAKPNVTTETGYWDGPPGKGLPDAIIARYEPRLFLEQFAAGIVRTFQYEFMDEGTDFNGIYTHVGLLSSNLSPKPQYYALQSLIAVLKDPGPAFTPGNLDYDLSGNTEHVEQMLFAKRDGSMYLALWLETSSYDVKAQREVAVPTQQVQLTIRGAVTSASTLTFDDSGHTLARPLPLHARSATLPIGDHLVIVRFDPPARS